MTINPLKPLNRVGQAPEADLFKAKLTSALEEELGGDIAGQYRIRAHALKGVTNFLRVSVLNKQTGKREVLDLRSGSQIGETQENAIDIMFHSGSQKASITGQIEAAIDDREQVDFKYTAPARLLARALDASLSDTSQRAKTLVGILNEGTARTRGRGGVISHAYNENDDFGSYVEGGLAGSPAYASRSLESYIGQSVPVLFQPQLDRKQTGLIWNAIRTNLAHDASLGSLGALFPGYAPMEAGHGRLVPFMFGFQEQVKNQEGDIQEVDRTALVSVGLKDGVVGSKAWKHGSAARLGDRREEATPLGPDGAPMTAGAFSLKLKRNKQGIWEPNNFNPYVELQAMMPYEENLGEASEPPRKVWAGLMLIPDEMPFAEGGAKIDTSMYQDVTGFAVREPKSFALSGIRTSKDLDRMQFFLPGRDTDKLQPLEFANLNGMHIKAGKTATTIAQVGVLDEMTPGKINALQRITLPGSASDFRLENAALSIPAFYNPSEGGKWYTSKENEKVISTEGLRRQLSDRLGIQVIAAARDQPEMILDYYARVDASHKGPGYKAGASPLLYGQLTVGVTGKDRLRVHEMSADIKSLPMAFINAFNMRDLKTQIAMVGRLGPGGRELGQWLRSTYEGRGQRVSIGALTQKWGELSGRQARGEEVTWEEFSKALLGTFEGDQDKMGTLKKYGIAYIDQPQWVAGDLLSETEKKEFERVQRKALSARLQQGPISLAGRQYTDVDSALGAMFQFTPTRLSKGETSYQFSFWMNRGLVLPMGSHLAPEMAGWGQLNYRQIAALSMQFPKTAAAMGLTARDLPATEGSDPAKRAWARVKQWVTYDREERLPGGHLSPGNNIASTITPEKAEKVLAAFEGGLDIDTESYGLSEEDAQRIGHGGPELLSDADRLTRWSAALRQGMGAGYSDEKMLYAPKAGVTGGFLFGIDTVRGIDTYNELTGESQAKISISHMSALEKALRAELRDGPVSPKEAGEDMNTFRAMMDNMLSAKGIAKRVFGYDAPGMTFSRYSGQSFARFGEVILSSRAFDRMLFSAPEGSLSRKNAQAAYAQLSGKGKLAAWSMDEIYAASQAGSASDLMGLVENRFENRLKRMGAARRGEMIQNWATDLFETQRRLAADFLPGFGFRQPDMPRQTGVIPMKITNAYSLVARGITPEKAREAEMLSDTMVNSFFSSIFVGDEDKDPGQFFLSAANGVLVTTGEMQKWYDAYDRTNLAVAQGREINSSQLLEEIFGKEQAGKYHILENTINDYIETVTGDKSKPLTAGMDAQRVPAENIMNATDEHSDSKAMMGKVYNMQRQLESAGAALGTFTDEQYRRMIFEPLQSGYQRSIDFSLRSATMLNILGTARVHYRNHGQSAVVGYSITGMDGDEMNWAALLTAGQPQTARLNMDTLINALGGDPFVTDETYAALFAPSGEAAERNLQRLAEYRRLQRSDPALWGKISRAQVMAGEEQVGGLGYAETSERSPFYLAFTQAWSSRTLKSDDPKYADIQRKQGQIEFPVFGDSRSILAVSQDPQVRLTDAMYGYQRLQDTNKRAGEMVKLIGDMRRISGGVLDDAAIGKLPLAMQSLATDMRLQLGERAFRRIAESPSGVNIEERIARLALEHKQKEFTRNMDAGLKHAPTARSSDISAWIGEKPWNPLDNIIGRNIGIDAGKIGRAENLELYGSDDNQGKLFKQGHEFEQLWKAHLPGVQDAAFHRIGESNAPFEAVLGASKTSLGVRIAAIPDWFAWDPQNRRMHVISHKMSDDARYGEIQAANEIAVMQQMLKDNPAGFRASLDEQLRIVRDDRGQIDIGKSGAMAPFYNDIIAAVGGGDMRSWTVGAVKTRQADGKFGYKDSSGAYIYKDPRESNWRDDLNKTIMPKLGWLSSMLTDMDLLRPASRHLLDRAEAVGVDTSMHRSWLGSPAYVRADASGAGSGASGAGNAGGQGSGSGGGGQGPNLGSANGDEIPDWFAKLIRGMLHTGVARGDEGGVTISGFAPEARQALRESLSLAFADNGSAALKKVKAETALSAMGTMVERENNQYLTNFDAQVKGALADVLGVPAASLPSTVDAYRLGMATQPKETAAALAPYADEMGNIGRAYQDVQSVARNREYAVGILGVRSEGSYYIQRGLEYGFDLADEPIGRAFEDMYIIGADLKKYNRQKGRGRGRAERAVSRDELGYLDEYAGAQDFYAQAQMNYAQQPSAGNKLMMQMAEKATRWHEARVGLIDLQSQFKDAYHTPAPQNMDELRLFMGLGADRVNQGPAGLLKKMAGAFGRMESLRAEFTGLLNTPTEKQEYFDAAGYHNRMVFAAARDDIVRDRRNAARSDPGNLAAELDHRRSRLDWKWKTADDNLAEMLDDFAVFHDGLRPRDAGELISSYSPTTRKERKSYRRLYNAFRERERLLDDYKAFNKDLQEGIIPGEEKIPAGIRQSYRDYMAAVETTNLAQAAVPAAGADKYEWQAYHRSVKTAAVEEAQKKAGLKLEKTSHAFEQMFSAELGGKPAPRDYAELKAFEQGRPNLSESQQTMINAQGEAINAVTDAGSRAAQYKATEFANKDVADTQIGISQANIKDFEDAMGKLNKQLEKGVDNVHEQTKAYRELDVSQAKITQRNIAGALMSALGLKGMPAEAEEIDSQGRPTGKMTYTNQLASLRAQVDTKVKAIRDKAAAEDRELTNEELTRINSLYDLSERSQTATEGLRRAENSQALAMREGSWGSAARNIMGGFGLMYLRSMGGALLGTTAFGLEEGQRQRAEIAGVMGPMMAGGMYRAASPQDRIERARALYGGSGMKMMQNIYADIVEDAPGLISLGQMASAGAVGFGVSSWLGGELAGRKIGKLDIGKAFGKGAPYLAATAGAASLLLNIAGAIDDPTTTSAYLAQKVASGKYTTKGGVLTGDEIAGVGLFHGLNAGLDPKAIAYSFDAGIRERVDTLQKMRNRVTTQGGEADYYAILADLGITDRGLQDQYIQSYIQMEAADYPEFSISTIASVTAFEQAYGYQFSRGAGKPRENNTPPVDQAPADQARRLSMTAVSPRRPAATSPLPDPSTVDLSSKYAGGVITQSGFLPNPTYTLPEPEKEIDYTKAGSKYAGGVVIQSGFLPNPTYTPPGSRPDIYYDGLRRNLGLSTPSFIGPKPGTETPQTPEPEIGPDAPVEAEEAQKTGAAGLFGSMRKYFFSGLTGISEGVAQFFGLRQSKPAAAPLVTIPERVPTLAEVERELRTTGDANARYQVMQAINNNIPVFETAQQMMAATGWGIDLQNALMGPAAAWVSGQKFTGAVALQIGAQRFQALGPLSDLGASPDDPYAAENIGRQFLRYSGMNDRAFGILQNSYQIGMQRAMLGLDPSLLAPEDLPAEMTPEQYIDWTRRQSAQQNWLQTKGGGMFAGAMAPYLNADVAAGIARQYGIENQAQIQAYRSASDLFMAYGGNLNQVMGVQGSQVMTYANQFGALVQQYGAPRMGQLTGLVQPLMSLGLAPQMMDRVMGQLGQALGGLNDADVSLATRIMSGDIGAASFAANNRPDILRTLGMNVDANRYMDSSGRPIYQSSGQAFVNLMRANGVTNILPTGISGEIMSAFMQGGTIGLGMLSNQKQYNWQMAQIGLSQQGINLQAGYMQQSWNLQQAMSGMQYDQQMQQFAYQRDRMQKQNWFSVQQEGISWERMLIQHGMSDRQAELNVTQRDLNNWWRDWSMQFERDSSLMQRQWTREDWAYQDQMTNMQFGWNMEDINEAIRYSHGRQRRQLLKQRERMTVQFNLEEEQTETNRERQTEVWAREDEHYEKQKEYIQQITELEKASFDLNQEARKRLQELDIQQFELSRTQRETFFEMEMHQLETQRDNYQDMYALQQQLAELGRKYNEDQLKLQQAGLDIQKQQVEFQNQVNLLIEQTTKEYDEWVGKVQQMAQYQGAQMIAEAIIRMMNTMDGANTSVIWALSSLINQVASTSSEQVNAVSVSLTSNVVTG